MIKKISGNQSMVASIRSSLRAALAGSLLFLIAGSAVAQEIPALSVIQPEIAAANPQLVNQREALLKERKTLLDRTNRHNETCSAVEAGSAADASCTKAYGALSAAIKSHIQASHQYNEKHLSAINVPASQKPVPHTDTSVVDARNVPSGLPKSVSDAIDGAYSSAPPGVSERVRKGFQAVMDRDWKVAKAWFQDALNRDPTNAGLKRLVALADSSQQPNQQRAPVDARNEPAGLGERSDAMGAGAPPIKTKPVSASTGLLPEQMPQESDLEFMNPRSKPMDEKEMMDILFGLDAQPPASKPGKTK